MKSTAGPDSSLGGDLFRLQKLHGHQSIETTQRYANLAPDAFSEDFGRIRLSAG